MAKTPEIKRAKAKAMIEMQIKGVPKKDIAEQFNCSTQWVGAMTRWGKMNGLIEEVSVELSQKTLPKITRVFDEILTEPVEDVDAHSKGYAVKAKAASDIARGLGVFRSYKADQAIVKGKMDLDGYMELRQKRQEHQQKLHPPVVEAEVIKES